MESHEIIEISEFAKLDLRIGRIVNAESRSYRIRIKKCPQAAGSTD